jgi:ribonuclease Z
MTDGFRVTLIGTGTPIPSPERFGPCTLVEAGNRKFLVDAGRGATIRLSQLKVPIDRIDVQFLTHFHSDHTSGLPDVWLTGWLTSYFGQRTAPYRVIGPTGAKRLMENLERAYADDIKIRQADEKFPLPGIATDVTEFDGDGVVYQQDGVKVISFEVDHGDVIKPCYGYRFEYGGRVAVLSSDTRYNANVIKCGAGADLLVHEVASAPPDLMKEARIQRIIGHHTGGAGNLPHRGESTGTDPAKPPFTGVARRMMLLWHIIRSESYSRPLPRAFLIIPLKGRASFHAPPNGANLAGPSLSTHRRTVS